MTKPLTMAKGVTVNTHLNWAIIGDVYILRDEAEFV